MLTHLEKIHNIIQYNSIITDCLADYTFYPSILTSMIGIDRDTVWDMDLPKILPNEKIILHTQDHLNVRANGHIPELRIIEEFYKGFDLSNIVLIHWNHRLSEFYDGEINLIEFPTHSFDFIQHLINCKDEWLPLIDNRTNEYDLICLNGKTRDHRIRVCDKLRNYNYKSKITLGWDDSYANASYRDYDFDNASNFIKLIDIYRGSNVNVVNETLYDEPSGIISEKTLDAFVALQLPIIIGHKGIISDIRGYGFDVFDDIIDHSYDSMPNEIRWREAIALNEHLFKGEFDYDSLLPRLKRNQEYIIDGYSDFMATQLQSQVKDMFSRMN
mgnify:CR=1 FL=1